jgi:hypothetical protein
MENELEFQYGFYNICTNGTLEDVKNLLKKIKEKQILIMQLASMNLQPHMQYQIKKIY